jgi:hypothetical protein
MAWEGAAGQRRIKARVKIIERMRRECCFFMELILFNKDGFILDRANYSGFYGFSQSGG